MLVLTSGMIMVDRIAVDLPKVPLPGATQFTKRPIEEHIGGHPANLAIDLVKLGMDPKEIGLVAAIGKDSGGILIENTINKYGLRSFFQKVPISTGQNLILVPKGRDRIFNIAPGANLKLTADHVREVLKQEKPKIFSVRPGYSGIDWDMISILKNLDNTFVFLDLMQPFNKEWSFILPAIKYATAVHCNEFEAQKITGKNTIEEAIKSFLKAGVKFVFITYGENGAQFITKFFDIRRPAFDIRTTDPTGCGDAFCAGVIKKLIEFNALPYRDITSREAQELLEYAQATGAACATGIGTTSGVSPKKLQEILTQ